MKEQVEKYIVKSVKIAISGLFLTLILGLVVRESTRGLHKVLSLYDFSVVSGFLELSHGHSLIFFTVIPLIFAVIFYLLKDKFNENMDFSKISIFTGLAHLGLTLALILMLYKGFSYVFLYKSISDLTQIDNSLFWGNKILRSLIYSVSHISMCIGLTGIGVVILKNIKK